MSKLSDKVGYTPGPLYVVGDGKHNDICHKEDGVEYVVAEWVSVEADGRLLCAAPAMLEVLVLAFGNCLAYERYMNGDDKDLDLENYFVGKEIHAAIESATGMSWEELNAEEQK